MLSSPSWGPASPTLGIFLICRENKLAILFGNRWARKKPWEYRSAAILASDGFLNKDTRSAAWTLSIGDHLSTIMWELNASLVRIWHFVTLWLCLVYIYWGSEEVKHKLWKQMDYKSKPHDWCQKDSLARLHSLLHPTHSPISWPASSRSDPVKGLRHTPCPTNRLGPEAANGIMSSQQPGLTFLATV